MDAKTVGLLVAVAGLVLIVVGGAIAIGALSWFGRLPGDIRIEGDNVKVYVPLASMLLVSVVLSLLLALFSRLR